MVLERLRDAALPEGVTPTLGPVIGGISEFYRYTLEGPFDAMQLREIQDWIVTPRLLQVPGVADVAPFGGRVRQYEIEIDPRALDKYKLSVRQIADAVKNNNRNAGGALMDMGQQSLAIRGSGLIRSSEDIENIVLDAQKGVPIFVKDVGRVKMGALPQTGIFDVNRQHQQYGTVEGIVLMRRGENATEVLDAIHEAVVELNQTRLPQNVRIVPIHDKTELVQNTLRTISRVLLEGFVIVVTVLLLFLLSVRAALLTALIIPFALLFAFICMRFTGLSMSLLSIGALDFGIIVDATIVMVERIVHRLAERQAEGAAPNHTFETVRDCSARRSAVDPVLAGDHHFGLYPAVDARACGAASVYADGDDGLLRTHRLVDFQPYVDTGARYVRLWPGHANPPESRPRLDQRSLRAHRFCDREPRRLDGRDRQPGSFVCSLSRHAHRHRVSAAA